MFERLTTRAPEYLIRPMALDDLDQVMRIERVAFPMPWPRRAYQYEISQNRHSTMLVLELAAGQGPLQRALRRAICKPARAGAGQIVGYGGFWLLVDEVHICTLAIDPAWRGRGLGELVLVSLLEQGMALGAHRATLEVRVSNITAQRLYQNCGFEVLSRQKRYYADNGEDAYIMATPPFESLAFAEDLQQRRTGLPAAVLAPRPGSQPPT